VISDRRPARKAIAMTKLARLLSTGLIVAAAALMMVAGANRSVSTAELTAASLRLKWFGQAQFVGYYVAKAKGFYAAEGIDLAINPGGPNIIAENLVGAGSDTFGHGGGAASLLQAREKGLTILGIAMLFQETPYRFVALERSGIKSFADLRGKKISTWFTGPQFMLYAMLKQNGIPLGDVKIEAQAASMTPFLEGQVDLAIVTVFNELLALKRRGVTPSVIFNPAEMGVNLPNEALIVNEKVAKENPKLVQGFLKASLHGWAHALSHQEEAIDILVKEVPNANRAEQLEQLQSLAPLVVYGDARKKGVGYIDRKQLEFTEKFLLDNGVLKSSVDLASAIDTSYWDNVPAADKIVP
jgi:NitT/TauT family transport system substrate-binding protein